MIPRSKEAVKDYIIASAFCVLGILLPQSLLEKGFEAHMAGVAFGIGLGWFIKSVIVYTKGVIRSES